MSRKTVRLDLVDLLATSTVFNLVVGYLPSDLGGKSRIVAIYNDTTTDDLMSKSNYNGLYTLNVDSLVKRTSTGDFEDDLDDMHNEIAALCLANASYADHWDHLTMAGGTRCFFAQVGGVMYRVEQHKVLIKENGLPPVAAA